MAGRDVVMKTDFLTKILEKKKEEVEEARKALAEVLLMEEARKPRDRRSLIERLSKPGPRGANIIAEIKKASPSRGLIRSDLDPQSYAQSYEKGGAAAISVLTDPTFFHGSPQDLQLARSSVGLPLLRKDFVISAYQVYQSAVMGADAVLLIVRALSRQMLQELLDLCRELRLDALVEVHSEEELEEATAAGARLIGINNRDLSSFQTDIETSVRISRLLVPGQVAVAESGIHERRQIERLLEGGIHNFLIGESLVRAPDPVRFLHGLLGISG